MWLAAIVGALFVLVSAIAIAAAVLKKRGFAREINERDWLLPVHTAPEYSTSIMADENALSSSGRASYLSRRFAGGPDTEARALDLSPASRPKSRQMASYL